MNEYFVLIWKCVFFYFIIVFALRLMGKREVGELSVFDIVIYLVMSELLALSITETENSILKGIIPLFTLAILQILLSRILLKYQKLRDFFDGKPVILIEHGIINQQAMKKERYSIDDMMQQLRDKNFGSPQEVAYAILENSGDLSILAENDQHMKYPFPLIQDGIIHKDVLEELSMSLEDLENIIRSQGLKPEEVFLCLAQKNGCYVLKKDA